MKSQKKAKLKDIILQTIDNRGKTPPLSEQGYELIEVNAINPSSRTPIYTNVRKFIDEETYKNWFRDGTIKADDILVPTVGTIGNVSISKEDRGAIAQNLVALRVNKGVAAPDYIYYLMYSESFKRSLINLDIGGVQPSIKVPHMLDLQLTLPPLSEQKRIANILSSFDNKIEILKKENKILEDIAENIFKEWFVKYNFPNKDGKPYKDSGGKMIDSELGPIPEGWRVGKLGDYINIKGGGTPSTKEPSYWNGRLHWTTPKDLSNLEGLFIFKSQNKITKLGLSKISSGLLPKRTLLLSSRAPIGYLALTGIETAINQGFIAFLPNSYTPNTYMYLWLKQNIKLIESIANGSTFLEINKENLRNFVVIIPPKELLDKFDLNITTFFERISMSENVIEKLRRTKTALLYKLIK